MARQKGKPVARRHAPAVARASTRKAPSRSPALHNASVTGVPLREVPRQRSARRLWLPDLRLRLPEVRIGWRRQAQLFALFSVAAVVAMLLLRPWISQLGAWGYGGAFAISLVSNATILLPAPGLAIIMMMAQDYDPLLLGVAAGVGGSIGALTAYMAGRMSSQALERNPVYSLGSRAMRRIGAFLIFIFTLAPFLPMDLTSILAGAIHYPVRRYLLWMGLAHVIKMTALTYAAVSSFEWLRGWLSVMGLGG